jgi:hypothetical protein
MAKIWTYNYGQDTIVVENKWSGETLTVNGELQDKKTGLTFRAELKGRLPGGEEVKATLGGNLTVKCNLFVNNKLLQPEQR